jgi:hypothetical protein
VYGKIFDSIYDGTLYGHWQAIVTMQQLIVLANADGVVDMTPQAISARTSIPLEIIFKGLQVLAEPDPYTRTPGEDGRRIVLIDQHRPWGWRLVNHGKYVRLRNMAEKREADRVRIAEKRKQNKDVASESQPVANVAHAYADADKYLGAFPPGISEGDWRAFKEHRTKLRKPMTRRAEELALASLRSFAEQGYDPKKMLDLAIEAGWQRFYPREECRAEVSKKVAL